jgi:hypothetical protein
MGIGNAAVAAQRCGVKRFIGIELDENYLSVGAKSMGEHKPTLVKQMS